MEYAKQSRRLMDVRDLFRLQVQTGNIIYPKRKFLILSQKDLTSERFAYKINVFASKQKLPIKLTDERYYNVKAPFTLCLRRI